MPESELSRQTTIRVLFVLTFTFLIALIVLGIRSLHPEAASAPKPSPVTYSADPCVPVGDDQCPTDQWLREWQHLQELNAEIAKDQDSEAIRALQAKIDTSLGLAQRLRQMVPQGYEWVPAKKRFVRAAAATAPTPVPAAKKPVVKK